jgi:excinuclease UvrABC nuclease subunit
MRNRKNFFSGWEDFDEIFRQFFTGDNSVGENKTRETGKDENGEWSKETFESPNGKIIVHSFVRTSGMERDIMDLFRTPKPKYNGVEGLKKELQTAIKNEDYELAIKIRDMIKEREKNQGTIDNLELELKECIEKENFERAIQIREELKKLKV